MKNVFLHNFGSKYDWNKSELFRLTQEFQMLKHYEHAVLSDK